MGRGRGDSGRVVREQALSEDWTPSPPPAENIWTMRARVAELERSERELRAQLELERRAHEVKERGRGRLWRERQSTSARG